MFDFHLTSIQFIRIYARTCTKKRAKVQKKMHIYKRFERKFIFKLKMLVYGLRRVALYRAPAKLALWEEEESRSSNAVIGSLYDKRFLPTSFPRILVIPMDFTDLH